MAPTPQPSQNEHSHDSIQQTVSLQTEVMSMLASWIERGPPLVTAMLDERNHHVSAMSGELQRLKTDIAAARRQSSYASYEAQRLLGQLRLEKNKNDSLCKQLSTATIENGRLQSFCTCRTRPPGRRDSAGNNVSSNHGELQRMLQDAKQRLELGNVRCKEVIEERDQVLQRLSDIELWKKRLLEKLSKIRGLNTASKQPMNPDIAEIIKFVDSLEKKIEELNKRVHLEVQRANNEARRATEQQKRADREAISVEVERKRANQESMKADVEKVRADKEKSRADEEMSRSNALLAELLDAKNKLLAATNEILLNFPTRPSSGAPNHPPLSHGSAPDEKRSNSNPSTRKSSRKNQNSDQQSGQGDLKAEEGNEVEHVDSTPTSKIKKISPTPLSGSASSGEKSKLKAEDVRNLNKDLKSDGASAKGKKGKGRNKKPSTEMGLSVSPPIKKKKDAKSSKSTKKKK